MTRWVRYLWPLPIAVYVICLAFVCSFIFFEILDVDGSDFPPPTKSVTSLNPVEGPHDGKRFALPTCRPLGGFVGQAPVPARERTLSVGGASLSREVASLVPPCYLQSHLSPVALARSSLALDLSVA